MAPEIILGDTDVDRRADVYALGCVAYYLLTGQLVFEADTPMKMLMQHLHTQPVPPSQRTELPIPRELDELVLRACRRIPTKRPQNAGELFRHGVRVHDPARAGARSAARRWWQTHLPDLTGSADGRRHAEIAREPNRLGVATAPMAMRVSRIRRIRTEKSGWIAPVAFTDVRAGEGVSALLLAANVFYLLAFYSVLKIVRDALILSEAGAVVASYASAGQALLLLVFVPAYGAFASRVNRVWLISRRHAVLRLAPRGLLRARLGRRPHRHRLLPLGRRVQHGRQSPSSGRSQTICTAPSAASVCSR